MTPFSHSAIVPFSLFAFVASAFGASDLQPWQEITVPTVAQAAAGFPAPPAPYRVIHWSFWGGQMTRERIQADVERLAANGVGVYMLNNSRGLRPPYFSPEYLDLVKYAVEECKAHGIKVWIEDDAGYPSGFAGGIISRDHPQLGMQGIVADARVTVAAGQTLTIPVPPDTLGILAYNHSTRACQVLPLPADGQLRWTAPDPGLSDVVFVRHVFRSSPTRYTNRADGTNDKDSLYSLIDYLDADATRTYLTVIHDRYAQLVGDEFGKTILGFRGDEPDYTGFMPWSPKLLETFQREKGYDLAPYLPRFFAPELTPEVWRAKADYWDVWSGMFRDNFFKPQADWCAAHGMEYMVHLNHEETMLHLDYGEDLVRNEGSFWRDMRYVQVPGVDNLDQIGPGVVADFPKLAGSAAHLFGRAQAWTEEGGGLGQAGKYVADYQLVRGINFLQIRGLDSVPAGSAPLLNPAAAMSWYVSRAGYLLALGRPAAQVALYHPTDSMWLGDQESNEVTVRLTTELMEHQVDFDDIDLDSLASLDTLADGGLKNLSGQVYRAVIIPTSTVISEQVLARLRAFAAAGGRVVFVGRTPTVVVGRTFLHPLAGPPDLGFATLEPEPHITAKVLAALPPPDVKFNAPAPTLKYLHRRLADGDVYFLFNEGQGPVSGTVTLAGDGPVQVWDATSGGIRPLAGVPPAAGHAAVPVTLAVHEARFYVIGPVPADTDAPWPPLAALQTVAVLDGDWWVLAGGPARTTPLRSWEELGLKIFPGIGDYRREFTLPAVPAGHRVFLDLGTVHEVARVRLNGQEFPARPWPPYRWDVTAALRAGTNVLEVQVQAPETRRDQFAGFFGRRPPESRPELPPTGVPGSLEYAGEFRGPPAGGFIPQPVPPPPASGLLGPVRLLQE